MDSRKCDGLQRKRRRVIGLRARLKIAQCSVVAIEQLVGGERSAFGHGLLKAVLAEPPTRADGVRHSVGVHQENVGGTQNYLMDWPLRVVKRAEHRAGGPDIAHAVVGDEHRERVTGGGERYAVILDPDA